MIDQPVLLPAQADPEPPYPVSLLGILADPAAKDCQLFPTPPSQEAARDLLPSATSVALHPDRFVRLYH